MNILIAGGSGLIGQELKKEFSRNGHAVSILSRDRGEGLITWNIKAGLIESKSLGNVEVLINLSGAGIVDKRWTNSRKKELFCSRIETTKLLFAYKSRMPNLKQYISASGITCYGNKLNPNGYIESDSFGNDYISSLVKDWEDAADLFKKQIPTVKIRIGFVLSRNSGAIKKMLKPIRLGLGAPIASGDQIIPWIHIDDLTRLFTYMISHELKGSFNAITKNTSNRMFMNTLAKSIEKKNWLQPVPAILVKILFGEMSTLLINGVHISNSKIKNLGFTFKHSNLDLALRDLELK